MGTAKSLDDEIPSLPFPQNKGHPQKAKHDQKRGKIAVSLLLAAVSSGALAYGFSVLALGANGDKVIAFNASRNYLQTPFDVLDAHQICQLQTKETHGSHLLTSHVDSHSSRFEPKAGVYKIFINAQIGEFNDYEDAVIHCYIDPDAHLIDHYKTVYTTKSSLMSRALSFFH